MVKTVPYLLVENGKRALEFNEEIFSTNNFKLISIKKTNFHIFSD